MAEREGLSIDVVEGDMANLADRTGVLQVKHRLPYSDEASLNAEEKQRYVEEGVPFEFSHTLENQIGGQIEAGFVLAGLYEDTREDDESDTLDRYMSTFIATRAVRAAGREDLTRAITSRSRNAVR